MSENEQRALGRVEGKIDFIIERLTRYDDVLEKHDGRLDFLEAEAAKNRLILLVLAFAISSSVPVLFHYLKLT